MTDSLRLTTRSRVFPSDRPANLNEQFITQEKQIGLLQVKEISLKHHYHPAVCTNPRKKELPDVIGEKGQKV